MSEGEKSIRCVYPRLQLAYLLQFAIWGSWSIALGGYMIGKMTGPHIGYLFMAVPIGAIVAPMFIGPIADRYFSAQKMLGVLHLISGAALVACGVISSQAEAAAQTAGAAVEVPFWPIMILMLLSGLCYMPSIPLINAVVFKHIPDNSKTPNVFIFGTVGWILVCLIIEVFAGGASTPNFFYIGGGCGLFLGLYAFTLPSTPPKGAPQPGEKKDILGLGALAMFKDSKFTIFVLCAFMVSIFGSNYYFPALVSYLTENGYPAAVALGTLNQFSELFFMALLAFCVSRFGLKWVLVLGMSAWALRYIIFTFHGFQFALIGLLLHGMAYAYLYTAAYMFGDKVAPDHLKASVQSLLAFLLLGIGQVLSGYLFGYQIEQAKPQMTKIAAVEAAAESEATGGIPMPAWNDPAAENSSFRYLDLAKTVKYFMGNKDVFASGEHLGKYQKEDGTLDLDKLPEKVGDATKAQIAAGIDQVKAAAGTETVTRNEWLSVQRHDWKKFFTYPAYFCIFWVVIFVLFGREPQKVEVDQKKEESAA